MQTAERVTLYKSQATLEKAVNRNILLQQGGSLLNVWVNHLFAAKYRSKLTFIATVVVKSFLWFIGSPEDLVPETPFQTTHLILAIAKPFSEKDSHILWA